MCPKIGGKTPKWMVYFMENPIKMDDLGVPLFLETPIMCIFGCTPIPTYPVMGNPYFEPYITWVYMGHSPQESLENTINTMGTLLGVHLIVP